MNGVGHVTRESMTGILVQSISLDERMRKGAIAKSLEIESHRDFFPVLLSIFADTGADSELRFLRSVSRRTLLVGCT